MATELVTCFRFAGFELQPAERRLLSNGLPMELGARAFNLLVALAERAGKLVSKDELLDLVWPNLVVEENNIQVQISTLRKVLGAGAIATVPGYGYRFTLDTTCDHPVARTPAATRTNNLPKKGNSFVGRAKALAAIRESLGKTRLLTLIGFGGIGKSRLVIEVAASVIADYPDGAWFVEMAPLTDPRLVPQAMASVLGVREEGGRPVVEALLDWVKDRKLLLILDCCEHLVDACAKLAGQLLEASPHLKILATSRERLNVEAETTYPVQSLAVPEPHQSMALEALKKYEAVQLFIDRAVAAQPAFQITVYNAAAVAEICRRVEGIPLAVELAAARLRGMSAENLAERLIDRFQVLTRGDPRAAPRQRTLRALIDWSYDLLEERERALLRRLAVFSGGCTLEAAEAVVSGGAVAPLDVLDLLADLIDKSLLVMEAGGARYWLLDTVREYAMGRLDQSGEGDAVRTRHLAFFLAMTEKAMPQLWGPEQGMWFKRFDLERENLLEAHAWCGRTEGRAELGLRLVFATSTYWIHRGGIELGHRITLEALARASAHERSLARCHALYAAGHQAICMGRSRDGQPYLEECLDLARHIGNKDRTESALLLIGLAYYDLGDHALARPHLDEALSLARELGSKSRLCSALYARAALHRGEGEVARAEPLYQESLALGRELGDLANVVVCLLDLASIAIAGDSEERPGEMLLEALEIVEQTGSKPLVANVLRISAGLAAYRGEWRRAVQHYGAASAQSERFGFNHDPWDEAFLAPLIARAREALGASAFAAAEGAGRVLSDDAALAEARAWLLELRQPAAVSLEPRPASTK